MDLELFCLDKASLIEKEHDAFSRGKLAGFVLTIDSGLPAAKLGYPVAFLKILYFLLNGHFPFTPVRRDGSGTEFEVA
jgi:hypothetical protein